MKIISVREHPEFVQDATTYIKGIWANENNQMVYEDCIKYSILSDNSLPQWYIMMKDKEIIGCAGLITNDFISRMDLYPWISTLFIEQDHRKNNYGFKLIDKACKDAKIAGFKAVYLCTDHIGYYEKYGFEYIGDGYHPWGEVSRIYKYLIK